MTTDHINELNNIERSLTEIADMLNGIYVTDGVSEHSDFIAEVHVVAITSDCELHDLYFNVHKSGLSTFMDAIDNSDDIHFACELV